MVLPVFIWFLISTVVSYALAPKQPRPKAAALEDFDVPTAEVDRPLPVLFGTKRITGPNLVWYGDLRVGAIKQRQLFHKTTVGYRYYLGLHFGICHGPVDELTRIEVSDKELWSGSATVNAQLRIADKFEMFGGDKREGGMAGTVDVMMGAADQEPNAYLAAKIDAPMPAFRGMFGLTWRTAALDLDLFGGTIPVTLASGGYIGTSNYVKPWAITCKRILAGWLNEQVWYPEKAEIAGGMNPAHIVYQALTDTRWGMGSPASAIDETSFAAAADALFDEGFGLSILWNQATSVDAFLQIVLDHINGILAFDRFTGKHVLRLIRGGYDPAALAEFDESNARLESLETQTWGETVNELTVVYTDPDTLKSTTVTVQDLGNVRSQGVAVGERVEFTAINSHELAQRVAARELVQRCTPLRRGRLTANREAWPYTIGDVVALSWARRNLVRLPIRILSVSEGTLEDGRITLEFLEDIYARQAAEYITPQTPGAEPPASPEPPADNNQVNPLSRSLTGPPSNPVDGDRYFIPASPAAEGDWTGHEGSMAEWDDELHQWQFIEVPEGVMLYDEETGEQFTSDGAGNTQPFGGGGDGYPRQLGTAGI